MNDLGLDSLDQVEVIMAMEDEFGEFTDDLHLVSTSLTHQNVMTIEPGGSRGRFGYNVFEQMFIHLDYLSSSMFNYNVKFSWVSLADIGDAI